MKAQHVVTGKDRDTAYGDIFKGICLAGLGLPALAAAWWLGVGLIVFGVLVIWMSVQRLRGAY